MTRREALWLGCASAAKAELRPAAPDTTFLLLRAQLGVVASEWPEANTPVPIGSLVKPFVAWAYAAGHMGQPLAWTCRGGDRCWFAAGHGRLTLVQALAQSCNDCFRQMTADLPVEVVRQQLARCGLATPTGAAPETLIGLGREWAFAPVAVAAAFLELAQRRGEPGIGDVLQGLRESALSGTSRLLRVSPRDRVLAKTGTAPCTHPQRHVGDGWAVVVWPEEAPRQALLVRAHGAPGAKAAEQAGVLFRQRRV